MDENYVTIEIDAYEELIKKATLLTMLARDCMDRARPPLTLTSGTPYYDISDELLDRILQTGYKREYDQMIERINAEMRMKSATLPEEE